MKKVTTGLIFTALLFSTQAQAEWRDYERDRYDRYGYHDNDYHWLERRQARQNRRIRKGIDKGQLTRKEAKKLWRKHNKVAELANCYLEDGWLSRKETAKLNKHLEKVSHLIHRYRHNNKTRHVHYRSHYPEYDGYGARKGNHFTLSMAKEPGYYKDFYLNW